LFFSFSLKKKISGKVNDYFIISSYQYRRDTMLASRLEQFGNN